jgi:tetratricopeptide (TPR) repeat protein
VIATATGAQLIRIARLRRFVGVFARGGDREATAEALAELARAARAGGLTGDALRRTRQAAELLTDEDAGEAGVRSLIHLAAACLDTGDVAAAASASEVAQERAAALAEPLRSQLLGCAALLAGIAHAIGGAVQRARGYLDTARDRLVAADQPEGAALALTQQGLLDVADGHLDGAQICFRFACDFYRASEQAAAAAEVAALAARAFAGAAWAEADRWFVDAIAEADRAGSALLGAELVVERAAELERAGAHGDAIAAATEAARRCTQLAEPVLARELALRARLQLARMIDVPVDALRHIEAAFEIALDLRDPAALASAMDIVVTGLVNRRFADASWRLVDRFRERLFHAGFSALAETAMEALWHLRA